MPKFYVTTPIYYINDIPHIGHAYTTLSADIVARYYKQKLGEDNVFFLTGTDEHGAKVATAAKLSGKEPKDFADSIVPQFQSAWKLLNINYSHFFRTTDERHEKIVAEILQKIFDSGFIYEGVYEGLYCEGCERFLTETDLVDGKCPLHPNKTPLHQREKNYFFKLSEFKNDLINWFESGQVKISPESKKNEILGKLKEELKDIAISREEVSWGIPIPWDNKQTVYVWVEALFNYYTATRFLDNRQKFWPADIHLIGKDILWFHTVIWCALLKAAGIELPKQVFAHGFFTINGQKVSKSLGNVISPKELVDRYGVDGARYLLLSAFPFGEDGDFALEKLDNKFNSDLANNLGNLVGRVTKLCEISGLDIGPQQPKTQIYFPFIEKNFDNFYFDKVLENILSNIDNANKEIDQNKLWEDTKNKEHVLRDLVDYVRQIAFNLKPFMPNIAKEIEQRFAGPKIKSAPPLFPRI